jgi:osmoprotectant transport system permease protein
MHYIFQGYNYNLSDPESIPNLFLSHLTLVGQVMFISLVVAIPIGIVVARYRRLYLPVISIAGLLYTIPSLAAFALLISIPIFGLSSATAILPLVLYNQLVLIRNTVAGIDGIDPMLLEVGRAMGMKPQQLLFRVTLPLALPVIVAGVRIATVTTIGISALASFFGQTTLGDLIFQNLAVYDPDAIAAGAILTAAFAIVADLLLLALQALLSRGRGGVSLA